MKKEIKKLEIIEYIGFNELDPVDREMAKNLVEDNAPKVKRSLHNITSLVVHLKKHTKGGHRDRFELTIRAIAPTRMFEVGKTEDWDLARTIHKGFDDLVREIEHEFKQ